MPLGLQIASLVIAVLGLVLGIFNAWVNYNRGAIRFALNFKFDKRENGSTRFTVEVINTGRIPISIKQVRLTKRRGPQNTWQLRSNKTGFQLPATIEPGKALAMPVAPDALDAPLMRECFTVMAETEDGRKVERFCAELRDRAAELKTTPPSSPPNERGAKRGVRSPGVG